MSVADYEQSMAALESHPEVLTYPKQPADDDVIDRAEAMLGLTFPTLYRRFLTEFGIGGFGSSEVYGIVENQLNIIAQPDVVWNTLDARETPFFPREYIVIYGTGNGELMCLDIGKEPDKASVVALFPGVAPHEQFIETIASDFGEFVLQLVKRAIDKAIGRMNV